MLVPAGAESFSEALRIGAECYHHLKKLLGERGLATTVGDEGGFAPDFGSAYEACEAILEAAERAGHRDRVALALDPATSELHRDGVYHLERQGGTLDTAGMIDLWADLCDRFPIVSIEDGLGESDWDGWQTLTDRLGGRAAARRRRPLRDERRLPRAAGSTSASATRSSSRSTRSARSPRRSTPSSSRTGTATARSSRTARARPRTRRSPISRSRRTPARSRRAHRRGPIASRSTTSCSGSRRSSATRRRTPAGRRSLGRPPDATTVTAVTESRATHQDRRDDRSGLGEPGDDRRADRGRHGRRTPQPLARDAGRSRAHGASSSARPRRTPGGSIALIADLQGPKLRVGDLVGRRRARGRRVHRHRGRGRRAGRRPPRRARGARLRASPRQRRPHRRRPRPAARRERRPRPRAVRRGRRRHRLRPQGRQPARHPAADPLADAQGPRRPRVRAVEPGSTTSRCRSSARRPTSRR